MMRLVAFYLEVILTKRFIVLISILTLVCTMSFLVFAQVFKGSEYLVLQGVNMARDYYFDTSFIVTLCVMISMTMITLELNPYSGLDLALLMRKNRIEIWCAKQGATFMIAFMFMIVLTSIQTSVLYLTPHAKTQGTLLMQLSIMSGFVLFYVMLMSGAYQVIKHSFAPYLVFMIWLLHTLSIGHSHTASSLSKGQIILNYLVVNIYFTGDSVSFLVRGISVVWLVFVVGMIALRHYFVTDIL